MDDRARAREQAAAIREQVLSGMGNTYAGNGQFTSTSGQDAAGAQAVGGFVNTVA